MTHNFRLPGSGLLAATAVAFAGFAGAQGLTGDAPLSALSQSSYSDSQIVAAIFAAARTADGNRLQSLLSQTGSPLARKMALWALADSAPDTMTWAQVDEARRELADWPRPGHRQVAAEKMIGRAPMAPGGVIEWFNGAEPTTAEGAMALANAYRQTGESAAAERVIRKAWRHLTFDAATQQAILAQFGDLLTPADHLAREDFLLYGAQGSAAEELLRLIPDSQQALARCRIAVRRGDPNAQALIAALPAADQTSPGLVYERILALRDAGDTAGALALARYLPDTLPDERAAERLWKHGALVVEAMQAGDSASAYQVAARSGLTTGADAASAQFYAGWLALSRLKNPQLADQHFARVQAAGLSPLTQSRALYWRGRAAEAEGDPVAAELFYDEAAKYYTTFYGQLAAAKAGHTDLVLGHDPEITAADRARFESLDVVRATRLLAGQGNREGLRAFTIGLSESLTSATDEAMLVDLARGYGEQELSMRVVRNAAKRGFILPERGYPVRSGAIEASGAEAPLVLSVTRQESGFDPNARSGVGARGMMQLMPATAEKVARQSGLGWGSLDDPDFNMKVGSTYLGQLVGQFSGSYVMAAAAYNAGPSRPAQWAGQCGDPRGSATDPLDFIECIPFSETRDYVMRVMEGTEVYRARLNGGTAPIALAIDLKRGGYSYQPLEAIPAATPAGR